MMHVKDRIKELRRVKASDLQPHPKNWRTHPAGQQNTLKAVLSEIGYADALLARETDEGHLQLIDGHLRAETTPDQQVPVLILDEQEADKLLATLDPLATLAEVDGEKLQQLLDSCDIHSEPVQQMLADLANDAGLSRTLDETPAIDQSDQLDEKYQILIDCDDETDQIDLLTTLSNQGHKCLALIA